MSAPCSYLFVPGNRPERFIKARNAGADAVIFDLEDAVQPAEKALARDAVVNGLDAAAPADVPHYVRINGAQTEWFADDIAALAAHPAVAGLILPKAEDREPIAAIRKCAHRTLTVSPIIESARGYARLDEVCGGVAVDRLMFGTLDFQLDLGMEANEDELAAFRSGIVLASRVAGLAAPVDGVSTAIDDAESVEADARRGRRLGFGGKLCIHPKQLAAVHRAYAWSEAEYDWAKRVLRAVEASGGAAVAVDGRMVDMPVILKAQRIAATPRRAE
ncbi:CoA ester lyase [Paraburkholderia sp. SARCC-3016]|jgi:citrate lyase subunit beta/citryl-CoA lyase|uniref:HpcH/HpaI aldolase/citrate lyase family protein n=1 Tax=Paraburkholderia sp. SARCC-3016 TaxID=3058611 RepID=UPI00280A1C03|nr:CoA ester lyase [Paraburkholderia sp. SARCC-3016]MDQ7982030.1 CoA ester lyase [Paraburkholderia sp. SARCC-3016]